MEKIAKIRGIVEGFYGTPWSMTARKDYSRFLKNNKFNFYLYAPKADQYLRKKWSVGFPEKHKSKLKQLANFYRREKILFGMGLSPTGLFNSFNKEEKAMLLKKISELNDFNLDVLSIQFDDMWKGNVKYLAKRQSEIVSFIMGFSNARKFLFCPTFYSFSRSLEKNFGKRPKNYFSDLNKMLPRNVDIIWTGPKVCSDKISSVHLEKVEKMLGRKPFIWDNYPVNDGPKNCKFLNIGPLKGRTPNMEKQTSGYVSNPMNQPNLSKIPLYTISQFFIKGRKYSPKHSFDLAVDKIFGRNYIKLFNNLRKLLQEQGLDKITEADKKDYIKILSKIDSSWSDEIIDWLNGRYIVDKSVFE